MTAAAYLPQYVDDAGQHALLSDVVARHTPPS
jgi:hypothetical protein